MSHLSSAFGADEVPTTVRFNGYVLCEGCSRGQHHKHSALARCMCDIKGCAKDEP